MMTKKDLLQYAKLKREKQHLEEQMQVLESVLYPKIPRLTGMPNGSGFTDSMAETVARYIDLTDQYRQKVNEIIMEMQYIEDCISQLEASEERDVMRLRYLLGKTWEDTAEAMFYSQSQCWRIHQRGLMHLRDK